MPLSRAIAAASAMPRVSGTPITTKYAVLSAALRKTGSDSALVKLSNPTMLTENGVCAGRATWCP